MRFVSLLMVSVAAMAAGVVFEPNRGQAGAVRAEFVARTREGNVAVRAGGLGGVRFVGADERARGVGEGAAGVSHYMRGADPAQWVRGVPRYSRVRYAEVYRGIDVVYYDNGGGVEFDFLLAPGADAGQIVMEFPEAFAVGANGDLVSGATRLRAPRAWQEVRGARKTVEVSFVARTARRAGLRIGAYDRRRPLVVDPTLEMATYLGGGDNEADTRIAGGPDGAIYVAGTTASVDFPASALPEGVLTRPQVLLAPDAYVARMRSDGSTLEWALFVGGTAREAVWGLGTDGQGNVYVMGATASPNLPVTGGAVRKRIHPGGTDLFVMKLDGRSGEVLGSTFLGVAGRADFAERTAYLAVGAGGAIGVAGSVFDNGFGTTAGVFQGTATSGSSHGFAMRLAAGLERIEYATYFDHGTVRAAAMDGAGNLILGGVSPRTDLVGGPALPVVNPVPGVAQGQPRQAFVTKLNGQGAGVVFSTPLHGGGRESQVLDIRVGSDQSVHVLGVTDGALFPKVNALEVDEAGGPLLTFLAKLLPGGGAPLQASVWSGPDSAGAQTAGLALRPNGQPCVLNGGSLRLQQTAGALVGEQPTFRTATLQCADDAGGKLALRTLLPGGGRYESIGMAADGAVLLAGVTNATLPVTPGVIQPTLRGGVIRLPGYPYTLPVGDAFAMKVSVANPAPRITMIDPPAVVLAEGSERTFSLYLYGTGFSGGMRITLNGKSVSGALLDDGRVELSGLRSSDFQGGTNRIAVTQTGPGGGSSEATIDGVYEPAVITRIVPPSVVQGAGPTKVQIFVVNLSRESRLVWNGQERAAVYVGDGGYLEVTLNAGELAQAAAIRVAVRNAGAGVSPEGQFTVLAAAGADGPPVLTESFRVLGFGNGVTLGPTIDLSGSGFTRGTRAYWDGVAVTAELASATRLTITPPAGDLGRLGMHEVYVENGGLRSVEQRIWVVRNVRPGLVAADRERPILYVAETAGSDFTLLTLEARTGETVRTTPGIGTFVRAMALGDDGRYLYLVCRADGRLLRRYDTQAGRVDLEWTVSPLIGIIGRILPLPGTPAGLAVYGQNGVTLFDGDRERLTNASAAGFPATAVPRFATASRLYLAEPLPGCWRWMEYDANGVSGGTPGCAAEAPADVVQDGRFVYLTDGKRAEVVTGPGVDRGYVADPGRRRVWELSNGAGGARVVLHDLTTGEQSLQWLFGTTSPLRFSDFLLGADGSAVLYTPSWIGRLP